MKSFERKHTKVKNKIVHIVTHEKFTFSYINGMIQNFNEYEHIFLVSAWSWSKDINIWESDDVDFNRIIKYNRLDELVINRKIRHLFDEAYKIIVSGLFGTERALFWLPKRVKKKMYWLFWGGDLYRNIKPIEKKMTLNEKWERYKFLTSLKTIRATILLTEGEREDLNKLNCGIKSFIAPFPAANEDYFDYTVFNSCKKNGKMRIVIGNSATAENGHMQVFDALEKFREYDIQVFCPLVYGNMEYREQVIQYGREIFADKFYPITEWVDIYEYNSFLGTCDVGIFAMLRQQALGNITAMLAMGKKVYLDVNGRNYTHFKEDLGYRVHNLEEISKQDYLSFCLNDINEQDYNIKIGKKMNLRNKTIAQWKVIFED